MCPSSTLLASQPLGRHEEAHRQVFKVPFSEPSLRVLPTAGGEHHGLTLEASRETELPMAADAESEQTPAPVTKRARKKAASKSRN